MIESTYLTRAKKSYDLNGSKQFMIEAGKQYIYSKGFGRYLVRFGADEVQMSEDFFITYFETPKKENWG